MKVRRILCGALAAFVICLSLLGCRRTGASDALSLELGSLTPVDLEERSETICFFSFDDGLAGAFVPTGYVCRGGEGVNGTGGLMLACPNGGIRPDAHLRVKGLSPGVRYRLSAQLLVNGLAVSGVVRKDAKVKTFGLDFYSSVGKCVSSRYVETLVPNGELPWTTAAVDFRLPEDTNGEADLVFFLKPQFAAERIAWDNVKLERLGRVPPVMYPVAPKRLQVAAGDRLRLRVAHFRDAADEPNLSVYARREDGRVFKSPVRGGFAEFAFGALPGGRTRVTFSLADMREKRILAEDTYPLFASERNVASRGCTMDATGRVFVDGKPFFPVGFVIEQPVKLTAADLKEMRAAGVNMLLPYRSIQLSLPDNHPPFGLGKVKKSLDLLHKQGFKVLFSLLEITDRIHHVDRYEGLTDKTAIAERIVRELKNHPAILGWFITDENPVGDLAKARALRERIAAIDPDHPVVGVAVRAEDFPWFGPTADALMVDSYPVYDDSPASHAMRWVRHAFEAQRTQCGLGLWWMQQGFNWGVYQRSRDYKSFRYPEEEETYAQVLLSLNYRARSVGFYAWDSFRRQDEDDPGSSDWFKPRILKAIRLARDLEPFFLSEREPTPVEVVADAGSSRVEAKRHAAGGSAAVVVTADGPGKASAVVRVGCAGLKSRFGRLKDLGDGSYAFAAEGMSGDVVICKIPETDKGDDGK